MSVGADFVNRITRGLFYLTPDLMTAMSDRHNAGTNSSWPLLAPSLSLPVPFEYYDSIFLMIGWFCFPLSAVKPFPDPDLLQFVGRKQLGSKGRQTQERLEASTIGFNDAFANTDAPWQKSGKWPPLIEKLLNMSKSVNHYYNRLYKQSNRQPAIHHADAPVRDAAKASAFVTVERSLRILKIPKDMLPLNRDLIASEEYTPIDLNEYMDGLDTMGRYRFLNKVKSGLGTPFQLWSWMKGGSSAGVSTHFLWKIPPKNQHKERAAGESKAAGIIGELTVNQDKYYSRAVMTTYLGAVVNADFINSKAAAKAVWIYITGSNVEADYKENVIAAHWALCCGDKDVVLDMRAMSGKKKDEAYDPFWQELIRQLEEYKTVHSRRHGADRSFMPFAVSIRSMIERVVKKLEADNAPKSLNEMKIKIPSSGYVGMQFAPKNKSAATALA